MLNDVLKAAEDRRRILDAPGASDAGDIDLPECVTLAADVCDAWRSCVGASEKAGPTYAAWIDRCDGSIENVGRLPAAILPNSTCSHYPAGQWYGARSFMCCVLLGGCSR